MMKSLILAVALCLQTGHAAPDSPFRLQAPPGFIDVSTYNENFRKIAKIGHEPNTTILGFYYTPATLVAMESGNRIDTPPFANSFVYRATTSPENAKAQFLTTKSGLKKSISKGLGITSPESANDLAMLKERSKEAFGESLDYGQTQYLAITRDGEEIFSFTMSQSVSVGAGASQYFIIESAFVVIGNDVVGLSIGVPANPLGRDYVSSTMGKWIDAITSRPTLSPELPKPTLRYNPQTGKIE